MTLEFTFFAPSLAKLENGHTRQVSAPVSQSGMHDLQAGPADRVERRTPDETLALEMAVRGWGATYKYSSVKPNHVNYPQLTEFAAAPKRTSREFGTVI